MAKHVIVVEDHENLAKSLRKSILTYFKNVLVDILTSSETPHYLQNGAPKPDLAVVSLRNDSAEIIDKVREASPDCIIVVITRKVEKGDVFIQARQKADAILHKPIKLKELRSTISELEVKKSPLLELVYI